MDGEETLRVLQLVDHDAQFEMVRTQSGIEPIILNKTDLSDPNYIDFISERIFSDGTGVDFIARCQCNRIEGNDNIGVYCTVCDSVVSQSNLLDDDNLICRNWLEAPKELPHGWLTPKVYLNLVGWLSYDKGRRNYLDDILDVETPIPADIADFVHGKGFHYLAENFDRIMDHFIFDHPVTSKRTDAAVVKFFLKIYRHLVFCHYIPVLNSAISPLVTQGEGGGNKRRYSDVTADYIIKAATELSFLEFSPKKKNFQHHVEKTTFIAFKNVIEYSQQATKNYVSSKKAIPRTHIFGSRYHFSIRGVITPIIGPHQEYELHAPWRMMVNTLRVHLYGILINKMGMTMNEAVKKVSFALQKVDPDIKMILDQMIRSSKHYGIPFLWNRPPSIRDGSVMLKYVTKIKTDIDDSSVSVTAIDLALPNGDFDGDNFAGILLIEDAMVESFHHMQSSSLIFDRNSTAVSSEIGIHKTLAVTWNRALGNI